MKEADSTKQQQIVKAPQQVVKAPPPRKARKPATPTRRTPAKGATVYRVRTDGEDNFWRAGILFGPETKLVDASSLSQRQKLSLLNSSPLIVEELDEDGNVIAAPKPAPKKSSRPTIPVEEPPRKLGDFA